VTYTGNLAAQVKVYASSTSGGMLPYLNLTISQGTGGSYSSCTGFSGSTLWGPNTVANLTAASWATGLGTWAPTGPGQTQTYKVSWSLVDDENAESTGANITLVREARNS
jgi:hypothetical protein